MDKEVKLRDGRTAKLEYLSEKDSTEELLKLINGLVEEKACILYNKKFTLEEEEKWKRGRLEEFKKRNGYVIIARVDGNLAGSSGCKKGDFKEKGNVCLGVIVAKEYRGLGLGEALLRLNVETVHKFFGEEPNNIYLSVFATNKAAASLYRKLGFKEFATLPKWLFHKGEYVDHIFMKL